MPFKRLGRTVVLIAALALASGLYFRKAADWTRSLQPFLVHGYSENSSRLDQTFLDPIIPLILAGSFDGVMEYATVIQITSNGPSSATISGDFFNSDGTSFPGTFRTNQGMDVRSTLSVTTLPVAKTLVLTADRETSGIMGWGRILNLTTSRFGSGNIAITTVIETRLVRTGETIYRFSVDSSSNGMASFILQRASTGSGRDVGFVVVNNSSMPANIIATLRDENGTTVATRSFPLGAFGQAASYVPTFFSLPGESDGPNYTNVVFDSDSTQLAAIALASGAGPFFTVPITRLR